MFRRPRLLSALLFSAIFLIACPAPEPPPAEITAVAEGFGTETVTGEESEDAIVEAASVVVTVIEREEYGAYLTDVEGRPLYLFMPDKEAGGSSCVNECVQTWPPLLVEDSETIAVADGLDESLLDNVEREDGRTQVTYNGWPLYHFTPDQDSETPQGHGMLDYGDEWYLVTPAGNPMDNEAVEVE